MNVELVSHVIAAVSNRDTAKMFAGPIADAAKAFGINTQLSLGFWLAQCAHESSGFANLAENMNYSAKRMRQIFSSRVTDQQAAELANKPIETANHVYAKTNGNNKAGDGWNFRGSGLIHITGRTVFIEAREEISRIHGGFVDIVANPDLVRTDPTVAAMTAAAYWSMRRCSDLAEIGNFIGVTRRINPALTGMESRLKYMRTLLPLCGGLFQFKP